ncbi:MAG: AraC family transcriptional regulator [Lachnospiraceae bacterium]|nr:AraC family transcriptional regulator [Lachnospiraceae bacterium]
MSDAAFRNRSDAFIDEVLVERARRTSGFVMFQPHYHPYYELYYLLSGHAKFFFNHTIYHVNPGDMILIPPHQIHKVLYSEQTTAERFTVNFTPESVQFFLNSCSREHFDRIFSRQKMSIPVREQSSVRRLFFQMEQESENADEYSSLQIKTLLFQLLTLLGRCQEPSPAPQVLNPSEHSIQEAARYIYTRRREAVTLEDAAETAHMSPTYFSRKFRQVTGFGFKEYLIRVRIQDSEDLLANSTLSITEVALACGFSDGNYFGDVFKKVKGMSPNQFRKQHGRI